MLPGNESPEGSDQDASLHMCLVQSIRDHIGPLRTDAHGNMFILVLIDAFSRWVELFPNKTTTALERIMNTVEKTSTGVTPAELILNNSIRLTERILLPSTQAMSSGQFALSDTMDEWIARRSILIKVARDKQLLTDHQAMNIQYIHTSSSHHLFVEATSFCPVTEDHFKY